MGSGYIGYTYTEGASERLKPKNLMEELEKSNVKFTKDDVILVTKGYNGKLLWLEKGNERSGLIHIMKNHKNNFRDVSVPSLIKELTRQKPYKHFEKNNGKELSDVYVYKKNGKKYLLAYGSNGYIVTFFRISGGRYV